MRPRGLSSSSPSKTYVGQVAVQNPQWVQVRKIFSLAAVSGSRSCSAVKSVCTRSAPFDHPSRIEDAAWIEAFLDPGGKRGQCGRLRFEHRDSKAQRQRSSDQGRVSRAAAVCPPKRRANRRGAAVICPGNRHPEQPPSPVQIPSGVEVARDRLPKLCTAAWCNGNTPDRPIGG